MPASPEKLSARQDEFLQEMGIDVWVRRDQAGPDSIDAGIPAGTMSVVAPDLESLRITVSTCTRCVLHQTRTQTVFGTGNPGARWLIIGEAPGAEEDRQGEPFVGPAGQLLTQMLRAVGLARSDAYIANMLKCRPPQNRDPRPEEVTACSDYLSRQIELVSPRLILVVGRIAAQSLLAQDLPLGRLRGRAHSYGAGRIPLVVTYHPAYLLRSPGQKRKSWEDLRLARRIVNPLQP